MSTAPAAQPAEPQPKTVRKRIYIPLIILIVLVVASVILFVRGTWADSAENNPATTADGAVTQLLRKPNGNVVIRCAILVDAPPKDVWAVVSGYDKHGEFLPYVSKVEAAKQPDGRFKINGIAQSRLWGDWPFESLTTHEEHPDDGEYAATWEERDVEEFEVNRGGWHLKPIDKTKQQTLLSFSLQIDLKRYPNFIVRNIIMDRLSSILTAMRDETLRRKKA